MRLVKSMIAARCKILLLAAFAIVALATWWFRRSAVEPSYAGKSLTFWVETLCRHRDDPTALIAIKRIGTNAVPTLIRFVRAGDAQQGQVWRDKLSAILVTKLRVMKQPFSPEARRVRYIGTLRAFEVLSEAGSNAIPDLTSMLADAKTGLGAAKILGSIGRPALGAILPGMESASPAVRYNALTALCFMGDRGKLTTNNAAPLSAVLKAVSDTNFVDARTVAVLALGYFHGQVGVTVPALTNCLSDTNRGIRVLALQSLSWLGDEAVSALPSISICTKDPDPMVREIAAKAVRVISKAKP